MPSVTLKEVARQAGVALSTASLALRNHPQVRRPTAKRVQEVAEQLGYRKNAAFAALGATGKQGRSRRLPGLGLVMQQGGMGLARFQSVADDFPRIAEEHGFRLEPFLFRRSEELRRGLDILWARGCGIALLLLSATSSKWQGLDWKRFAVVHLNPIHPDSPFHTVRRAMLDDVCRAWRTALDRGYQRIGAVFTQHESYLHDDLRRLAAVTQMHIEQGENLIKIPVCAPRPKESAEVISGWLHEYRPDCVIALNGGLTYHIRAAGMTIPQEVGFISLNERRPPHSPQTVSDCSGFTWEPTDLFSVALEQGELLFRRREFGLPEVTHSLVVRSTWREGETLPVRNPTSSIRPMER